MLKVDLIFTGDKVDIVSVSPGLLSEAEMVSSEMKPRIIFGLGSGWAGGDKEQVKGPNMK